jgi:peptidoglycan/xylan/chitin deacetylase (PgdA/CDA1 family)
MGTPEIATFLYHEVTDDPTSSGFQRPGAQAYRHTVGAFSEHLNQIAASGRASRPVNEIDFGHTGRFLMITFDDGGKSALTACEQLNARNWKGHFFVITGLMEDRLFLDKQAIRYIRSCGHVIGSHSHTHPDIFRSQSLETMIGEWRTSCSRLSDLLGESCEVASIPGGDLSPRVVESAEASGIRFLFTSEPWLRPRRVGKCWVLGRVCPKVGTAPSQIARLARFQGWKEQLLSRRAKNLVRVALHPLYTYYVRRSTIPY